MSPNLEQIIESPDRIRRRLPLSPRASGSTAAVVLFAAATAACGDRSVDTSVTSTVDTLPSGVVHVLNQPADPDAPPAGWTVEQAFRVGSGDEPGVPVFGEVVSVELDDAGNLYVIDRQPPVVRVFGATGAFAGDIGREGEGAGEYTRPDALVFRGGQLWVRDRTMRRYTAFGPGGEVVAEYTRRAGLGDPVSRADGGLYEELIVYDDSDPDRRRRTRGFLRSIPVGSEMQVVDTMLRPTEPEAPLWRGEYSVSVPGSSMVNIVRAILPMPFSTSRHDGIDSNGRFWTGTTDAHRFVRVTDGDTTRIVERGSARAPLSSEAWEHAIDSLRESFPADIDFDEAARPDSFPAWTGMMVTPEGELWVQRFPSAYPPPPESPRRWDVYGEDGVFLGSVELPFVTDPRPAIRGNRMAGVVRDSLGVDHVVVLTVERGAPMEPQ